MSAGRVVERHVRRLGVINSSSTMAWRKSIEDLEDGAGVALCGNIVAKGYERTIDRAIAAVVL